MAFQTVDASTRSTGRASSKEPQIGYYGKTSQFRLNAPALELLGNPSKLEVMYDDETNRIAFVPSDAAYAVTLRQDSDSAASKYFGFRTLANRANLATDSRFTLPLVKDEESGYYVIALNDATPVQTVPGGRGGRRKKNATVTEDTADAATTGETAETPAA